MRGHGRFSQTWSHMSSLYGLTTSRLPEPPLQFGQLLSLKILPSSKNWTISIIVQENIPINKQNRLIAYPLLH